MCGRFTITTDRIEGILTRFNATVAPGFEGYHPRYNAAPSQMIPAVVAKDDGQLYLMNTFWGFIPPWGEKEDGKISYQINIRDDTIKKNRFFHDRLVNRRCIIPADGFYEWKKTKELRTADNIKRSPKELHKIPHYIRLRNGGLFALAGLWRSVKLDDKVLITSAIITTKPNGLISSIHDRMPVILSDEELKLWLDPGVNEFSVLHALLDPYPEQEMETYAVSTLVNSGRNDTHACIEPAI